MNILTKHISRFLFAIPMLLFGIFHFMNASDKVTRIYSGLGFLYHENMMAHPGLKQILMPHPGLKHGVACKTGACHNAG